MADTKCMGEHKLHICKLAEDKKFGQIKTLMLTPRYLCENCGRAADKSENLCNPKHINQIGLCKTCSLSVRVQRRDTPRGPAVSPERDDPNNKPVSVTRDATEQRVHPASDLLHEYF